MTIKRPTIKHLTQHWAVKAAIAGLSGSVAHALLMYSKSRLGLLPGFQPYHELQVAIGQWIGKDIHPAVPWLLSYLNGSTVAGMAFGRAYRVLPGASGAVKGLVFGVFGWLLMGTVFFPLLGLGLFASGLGLGIRPALFSLAMLLAYSIVLGTVYGLLDNRDAAGKS